MSGWEPVLATVPSFERQVVVLEAPSEPSASWSGVPLRVQSEEVAVAQQMG